jgi:hypothetical protein
VSKWLGVKLLTRYDSSTDIHCLVAILMAMSERMTNRSDPGARYGSSYVSACRSLHSFRTWYQCHQCQSLGIAPGRLLVEMRPCLLRAPLLTWGFPIFRQDSAAARPVAGSLCRCGEFAGLQHANEIDAMGGLEGGCYGLPTVCIIRDFGHAIGLWACLDSSGPLHVDIGLLRDALVTGYLEIM